MIIWPVRTCMGVQKDTNGCESARERKNIFPLVRWYENKKPPHCYEVILGYRVCFFNYLCKCFSVEPKKKVYSLNRFFTNQRKSSDHFSDAALVKYVPIQQGEPQKFCGVFYYTYFMLEGKPIIHYVHTVDVLFGPSVRSPMFKMAVSFI